MNWDSECKVTRAWLAEGIREVGETFKSPELTNLDSAREPDCMNERLNELYTAVVTGELKVARRICETLKSRGELHSTVLGAIKRLESDWRVDRLAVHEIANAFWTTRRALDALQTSKSSPKTDTPNKALIVVREGEEHSFGAQLLADRLERLHWDVEMQLNARDEAVLDRAANQNISVVGFSIGCDQNLLGLADMITSARIESFNPHLKVILGGSAFDDYVEQYEFLGADAVCNNGEEALKCFMRFGQQNDLARGAGYA